MNRQFYITTILCFGWISIFAQSPSTRVVGMFGSKERGIWIRQYEGYSDDIHYSSLVLGHSAKEYKGIFSEKGLPDYVVEGDVSGKKLQLLVLDASDVVVGYIQGSVNDSTVVAQWNNVRSGQVKDIRLDGVVRTGNVAPCGANKSIKEYSGRFNEGDVELMIQREEEGLLFGKMFLNEQSSSYTLKGYCVQPSCELAILDISNHLGADLGQLKLEKVDGRSVNVILSDDQVFLLEKKEEYEILCGSQIVNNRQLSYVIPNFNNAGYQKWLQGKVNQWLKSFSTELEDDLSEYRFWVDIEVIGETWISGLLHKEVLSGKIVSSAFVYDLKKSKPVMMDQLVRSETEWNNFILTSVDGEKGRNVNKEEEASKAWYSELEFTNVTLRKEGVCLHSAYSRLHGSREIVLPWKVVDDYLRKPASIRKKLN